MELRIEFIKANSIGFSVPSTFGIAARIIAQPRKKRKNNSSAMKIVLIFLLKYFLNVSTLISKNKKMLIRRIIIKTIKTPEIEFFVKLKLVRIQ